MNKTTGQRIYQTIQKLTEELRQLNMALDEIEKGTLPHNLLAKALEEKRRELQQAERTEWTDGNE